jgi:hypothetical protein
MCQTNPSLLLCNVNPLDRKRVVAATMSCAVSDGSALPKRQRTETLITSIVNRNLMASKRKVFKAVQVVITRMLFISTRLLGYVMVIRNVPCNFLCVLEVGFQWHVCTARLLMPVMWSIDL